MAYIYNETTGKTEYVPDSKLKPPTTGTGGNTNSAPANNTPKKTVYTSDNLGVRDSLTALGYNNDDIGWDGKNVTYKGSYLLTPETIENDKAKTTPTTLIQSINDSNKARGIDDSIVDVTSYAAGATKLPYAITHSNGVVSLGGIPIQNTVIIDGVAYAPRSSIDAAVKKFSENPGPNTKKAKEYLGSTESQAKSYEDQITNYGPFTYNPETDPAYIAYRDAYTRNAKKALDDTYAQSAARTGGYANTAALTASNQAYYNHISELADRIPQLMDNAYDRYINDYNMLIKGLDIFGTPYDRYLLESDALKLDMDAASKALEADYERDIDTRDFNYDAMIDDRDFSYKSMIDERDYELELWERDHVLTPESQLLWSEVEDIPLDRRAKEADIANTETNTAVAKKRYGVK